MKHDANSGISFIRYNLLNLPEKISFYKGDVNLYKYDAMGQKRQVKHFTARSGIVVPIGNTNTNYSSTSQNELTTDYLAGGNIIYAGGGLKMVRTEEGYVERMGNGYRYYLYMKDHLGNNRSVVDVGSYGSWYPVQEMSYYPFGMPHPFGNSSPERQPYKHNDCELDEMHGLNVTDHGNRGLYHTINRYTVIDRFAEKFPWQSPYVHAGNNPVNYIDVNGDSISLWTLQQWDTMHGTDIVNTLLSDLSSQTGLTYSVSSTGVLTYATDGNGQAIVTTTTDASGNTIQVGSQIARDIMTNAIGHSDMINVQFGKTTGVVPGTNNIAFNVQQIEGLINGAVNVDSRTQGWGMTFMHETQHTQVGGGRSDFPNGTGNPGPIETTMNQVRAELNAQGGNYGQRMSYSAEVMGGHTYMPFNGRAGNSIRNGFIPSRRSQFIRF
jgi:RHS repeat-associated protein